MLTIHAQENHAPSAPGAITVSDITAHSARIAWAPATDVDGDELLYLVSIRRRIEGVAQAWSAPQETHGTNVVWDGLAAGAVYDVKVVASDGKVFGLPRLRENAFTTLREAGENHPPSTPRGMEFSNIGAHSVRISWPPSTDADNDPLTYQVSLRKRIEGQVFEWLPPHSTSATFLGWDGLESETVYDARVRASDGKSVSRWFVKERAFRTTTELNAPGRPGEISITNVMATSARVSWHPATGPAGVTLIYKVQVRQRIEGIAQAWVAAGQTTNLTLKIVELRPATVYDVRVQAVASGIAGDWRVKEFAFKTLALAEINHPPSKPGPLEVSELTPYSVRLSWRPSTDPDGDPIIYSVWLRKRVNGMAQPWSEPRTTGLPRIVWDGLSPHTIYEVRIRAWDGKAVSETYLKENAFTTPAVGDRLLSFAKPTDAAFPDGQKGMLVVWPDDGTEARLDAAETVGQWVPCLEIETDGTNNRALVPMNTDAKFFRTRR